MAKTAVVKISPDIEYKVIGNALGLLIASGGLLAGAMVSERSLAYWREDVVPLALLVIMGVRLFRSFVTTMNFYQQVPPHSAQPAAQAHRENVEPEPLVMPQISAPKEPSPEQVVEEVLKRIEVQKAEQAKKNKHDS